MEKVLTQSKETEKEVTMDDMCLWVTDRKQVGICRKAILWHLFQDALLGSGDRNLCHLNSENHVSRTHYTTQTTLLFIIIMVSFISHIRLKLFLIKEIF